MNLHHLFLTLMTALLMTNAQANTAMLAANPMLRAVNSEGAPIPGISSAVVVESGRLMFISGHVPVNENGAVSPTDLEIQLDQFFSNLGKTLAAAGATSANLARITIYVRDLKSEQLPVIRRARDRFINQKLPPASALIGVAELFHPNVLVEVDAVAVLP